MSDGNSVVVAVRVRPMNASEIKECCQKCTAPGSNNQIVIGGKDKAFTFDHLFWEDSKQIEIYRACIENLVQSFFEGYNATILAYGQTGSGKTHTMGTGSVQHRIAEHDLGILPRVIKNVFEFIQQQTEKGLGEYQVRCSFLEIHNEDIVDLLDESSENAPNAEPKAVSIRESTRGEITVIGVEEQSVSNFDELMGCLEDGSLRRATGSTNMNTHSSRSHAIFSIFLSQRRRVTAATSAENSAPTDDIWETIESKFRFVDLAGSERLKRTGAVGERMKEGISINSGLLALGNVISALGDPKKKGAHVPFRDSKITRLLQDSLGGNSRTLMVACVSPADVNFEETLNALNYANRARNIRNTPVVNRDPITAKIDALRARVHQLEQVLLSNGIPPPPADDPTVAGKAGSVGSSSSKHGNVDTSAAINSDNVRLRESVDFLESEVRRLGVSNQDMRARMSAMSDELLAARTLADTNTALLQRTIEAARSQGVALPDVVTPERDVVQHLNAQLKAAEDRAAAAESQCLELKVAVETAQAISRAQPIQTMLDVPLLPDMLSIADGDIQVAAEMMAVHSRAARKKKSLKPKSVEDVNSESAETDPETAADSAVIDAAPESEQDSETDDDIEDEASAVRKFSMVTEQVKQEFVAGQQHLKSALKHIDSNMSEKQNLMVELIRTREHIMRLRGAYERKIGDLETEIKTVRDEHHHAQAELEHVSAAEREPKKKIADQAQKRLRDLETQLESMRDRLRDYVRMQRLRVQDDARIRQLQAEIDAMKRQRVQVQKQLREQSDKHRGFLHEAETQIKTMRRRALQRDKELRDVASQKDQLSMVIKRKTEENTALHKRLQSLTQRQASAAASRAAARVVPSTPSRPATAEQRRSPVQTPAMSLAEKLNARAALRRQSSSAESELTSTIDENKENDQSDVLSNIKLMLNAVVDAKLERRELAISIRRMVHQERDLESEIQNAMASATTLQERYTAAESQLQLSARAGDEPDVPVSPVASTSQSFASPLLSPAQARARTVKMARQLESEHTEAEQRCEALQQQLKYLQSQLISKRDAYATMVPSTATSEVDSELAVDSTALEPVIANLQSVEEARPVMAYLISQVALWKRRRIAADSDAEALRDRADAAQGNALDAQQRIDTIKLEADRRLMEQAVQHEREKRALMLEMQGLSEEWASTGGDSNDDVFVVHRNQLPPIQLAHSVVHESDLVSRRVKSHNARLQSADNRPPSPGRGRPPVPTAFNPASLERLVTPTVSSQNKFKPVQSKVDPSAAAHAAFVPPVFQRLASSDTVVSAARKRAESQDRTAHSRGPSDLTSNPETHSQLSPSAVHPSSGSESVEFEFGRLPDEPPRDSRSNSPDTFEKRISPVTTGTGVPPKAVKPQRTAIAGQSLHAVVPTWMQPTISSSNSAHHPDKRDIVDEHLFVPQRVAAPVVAKSVVHDRLYRTRLESHKMAERPSTAASTANRSARPKQSERPHSAFGAAPSAQLPVLHHSPNPLQVHIRRSSNETSSDDSTPDSPSSPHQPEHLVNLASLEAMFQDFAGHDDHPSEQSQSAQQSPSSTHDRQSPAPVESLTQPEFDIVTYFSPQPAPRSVSGDSTEDAVSSSAVKSRFGVDSSIQAREDELASMMNQFEQELSQRGGKGTKS